MFWLITLILLLLNENSGEEKWLINSVRNTIFLVLMIIAASYNSGLVLVISLVGLSAFVGYELYLTDCRRHKKTGDNFKLS